MAEPSRELAALTARFEHLEAQARRMAEERDWAEEANRVYRRAIERQVRRIDALEVECERLRMRLAAEQEG